MTDPNQLTEESPETPQDLDNRGLILSSGEFDSKKIITEDLPEGEEDLSEAKLLTED